MGIRNSEYFDDHEQISIFVPCRDWGSKILNPWGIKNRLLFCSVKLWAGGSEILNAFITMNRYPFLSFAMMGDQKFWLLLELKIDYCFVLLSCGPGDQKFWISPRKKAQWVYNLFYMKLHNLMELENWMRCFLWTQLNTFFSPSNQRKPFRNTNFFSIKYQYSSEFFQIGWPHFSLEGVAYNKINLYNKM